MDLPIREREIRISSANGFVDSRTSSTQITLPIRVPSPTGFFSSYPPSPSLSATATGYRNGRVLDKLLAYCSPGLSSWSQCVTCICAH